MSTSWRRPTVLLFGAALIASLALPFATPAATAHTGKGTDTISVPSKATPAQAAAKKKCPKPKKATSKKCPKPKPKPKPTPTPTPAPTPQPDTTGLNGDPNSYAFIGTDDQGRPAHWNKCKPIVYAINPAGAPAGGVELIREGINRLAAASGFQFQDAGATTVVPYSSETWDNGLEDASIDLYISYATAAQVSYLSGGTAGIAGPAWSYLDREPEITYAGVALDSETDVPYDFSPGGFGTIVIHELGHAMNLAHVTDPTQVMYPTASEGSPLYYQAGDVSGFKALQSYNCF